MNKRSIKINPEYIFPAIHFLLTFLVERVCFVFEDNWSFVNEIPRNSYISDKTELVITYLLSKLCAGIIIWLLWKLIFGIIRKRIPRSTVVLFGVIYLLGVVVSLFFYPNMFFLAWDNLTTYSMAIRFLPTYWQSVYTGVVYAGPMMVIPHPYGIFVFQWLALVAVTAYIFTALEKLYEGKNIKYLSLLVFLFPETFNIMYDAYRNNYFTVLCMFYFTYIFLHCRTEEEISVRQLITVGVMSAFIMVWRSEGLLIGAGGILLYLLFKKQPWKKMVTLLVMSVAAFLLFNSIQGIGAKKYYGQDYMIVNTADVLRSILNDPAADLTYEGVGADLAAIEAVVPVQVLKEGGLTGLRNYNWTMGRTNFNQTLAEDEAAAAYMKAYYSIVLNNISSYLNVQTNYFFSSLGLDISHATYSYTGESQVALEPYVYYRWEEGSRELMETPFTADWERNPLRVWGYRVFTWFTTVWRELWENTGISELMHAGVLVLNIVILLYEMILFVTERTRAHLEYVVYFMILMGEFLAIFLFLPWSRAAYLYPMLYCSYLMIGLYIAEKKFSKKKDKVEELNG